MNLTAAMLLSEDDSMQYAYFLCVCVVYLVELMRVIISHRKIKKENGELLTSHDVSI